MNTKMKESVLALTIFEAARMALGHATARPLEVKKMEAESPRELLLKYADILNAAFDEEYVPNFPAPVLPTVDVLAERVAHSTCTGHTTIGVLLGGDCPRMEHSYSSASEYEILDKVEKSLDQDDLAGAQEAIQLRWENSEIDPKTVVAQLMHTNFGNSHLTPNNAALLWLLEKGIFTVEELLEHSDVFQIETSWSTPEIWFDGRNQKQMDFLQKWARIFSFYMEDDEYTPIARYYDSLVVYDHEDEEYKVIQAYAGSVGTYTYGQGPGRDDHQFAKEIPFKILTATEAVEVLNRTRMLEFSVLHIPAEWRRPEVDVKAEILADLIGQVAE